MESFDPFYEWLGRPPGRTPENHYELLGLERFEADLDLISSSADTLRAKIRKIRPGKHLADWQRILDRVEAAKICLSDPIAKAAYDESIDTASHSLHVSGHVVVTDSTLGEEVFVDSPSEENSPGFDDFQEVAAKQAVPQFVEAPPVVDSSEASEPEVPADPPFVVIQSRERGRSLRQMAICFFGGLTAVLATAVVLVLLKHWQGEQVAVDPEQPSISATPSDETKTPDPSAAPTPPTPPLATNDPDEKPASVSYPVSPTMPGREEPPPASPPADPPKQPSPQTAPDPPTPPSAEPSPAPPIDPARQQVFHRAIGEARSALAARNLGAVSGHLTEATAAAQTEQEVAEADQLEALHAYVDAFWDSLRQQIPKLETGSELRVGQMMVIVVEAGQSDLVLRVSGQNRRFSVNDMPHGLAAALAEQLFSKSPNAKVLRASFLIAEPKGDANRARQLLEEASQGGEEVDELVAELNRKKQETE